jgi:serpin B
LELVEDGATASSDNREELDRLLGPLQLREQVKALQEFDTTSGDVQLNMATSVWADDLKDSFINHAMTEHSAEAFDLPKTYAPVDDWIEEKTNGMITELMGDDPLDPLTRALLVDTVYFKGTWAYSFDPSLNSDGKFYYRDGSDTEVTYMKDSRTIEAVQASPILGDASFVKLDYGQDTEFTAMFILPKSSSDESMNDVITGLNSQPLSELLEEAQTIPVELKLPRFHLDFGPTQLKPVLKNMGMNIAFDINLEGKFNRMSYDRGLYVEDVHHGACIEINEEGTEASAATVVVVSKRSTPRITPFQIEFDRPFVVVILHQESGVPLFIGKVEKPDFT